MKQGRCILLLMVLALAFTVAGVAGPPLKMKGGKALKPSNIAVQGDFTRFDVNNISTFIRNNGSFNRDPGTGNAGFEWPKGSGNTANYASGIWLGGYVGGDPRVAVAEYSYEFNAGPIGPGIVPEDDQWRVYKIKVGDNASNSPDYAAWPWQDGAPVVQKLDGTGDSLDASGNRIPKLIGDMTVWCVFNDNDPNVHTNMQSAPLGVEVQLTAFGFNRGDALGNTIFYKWKIINKGGNLIDNAYVTVWTDVDLGDSGDDYDGCDTTLGIGFTYNADPADGVYGTTVPATGFDFLQGPLVPGSATDTAHFPDGRIFPGKKLLKMTSFLKYSNDATDLGNPSTAQEVLNYMSGKTRAGHDIVDDLGRPTPFMFPGDPNLAYNPNTNWIESGAGGDRRFMMSAGPFTMAVGDTQEIVAGNLIAQGIDYHNSVTALKRADDLVQTAYDLNFALAAPPPSPEVRGTGLPNEVVLSWGDNWQLANLIENYSVADSIAFKAGVQDITYEFEGYSVYQLANASKDDPRLLATFDRTDTDVPLTIIDQFSDPALGTVTGVVRETKNTGIFRTISITTDRYTNARLINDKDYYFAVTAWAYNDSSIPKIIESPMVVVTVRPTLVPGMRTTAGFGDTITSVHTGPGDGSSFALVVNPRAITGHQYKVVFDTLGGGTVWNFNDVTTGQRLLSNQTNQTGNDAYAVVDGMQVKVLGAAFDMKDIIEVANANGPHDPTLGEFLFNGSGFPSSLCPDVNVCDRPTPNVGGARWGIHTGNNAGDPTTFDFTYANFVSRVFRGDNFSRFVPYDWEIRFTAAGGKAWLAFTDGSIMNVPFELWNVGIATPNDPSDDYRVIPWVLDANDNHVFDLDGVDHTISGGDNDPETDWIYWYTPHNKAAGQAGYQTEFVDRGANYDGTDGAGNDHEEVMARVVLVNYNGGSVSDPTFPANMNQQLPETGQIIRIIATKPNQAFNDEFAYNTASYSPILNQENAVADLGTIQAVPNPYFGANAYERNQLSRVVRITNLPTDATIRIFNLGGDLVRTITKSDPTTTADWDLTNRSNLPVASGMYLIYVEVPNVGTRVIKLAVIMAEERLDNF